VKVSLSWVEKMQFRATAGNHTVSVDAKRPIGDDQGILPKELLLASMASCTAMDVAALLRKHKQVLKEFTVAVDATPSEGKHPKVFTQANITFEISGDVDPTIALDSVRASQTVFCGVSAMLSRAFPIHYEVIVNGAPAGTGQAEF